MDTTTYGREQSARLDLSEQIHAKRLADMADAAWQSVRGGGPGAPMLQATKALRDMDGNLEQLKVYVRACQDSLRRAYDEATTDAEAGAARTRRIAEVVTRKAAEAAAENEMIQRLTEAIGAVRNLCDQYTPTPPPLLRGPGLSEHGTGYAAGARDIAAAVLSTILTALHTGPWCSNCDGVMVRRGDVHVCVGCGEDAPVGPEALLGAGEGEL